METLLPDGRAAALATSGGESSPVATGCDLELMHRAPLHYRCAGGAAYMDPQTQISLGRGLVLVCRPLR